MKTIFALVVLMFALPQARAQTYGCSGAPGKEQGEIVQICNINFLDLVRDPEKYEGRSLIVRGLVAGHESRLRLFASRDAHIYGGGYGGIELWVSGNDLRYLRELADQEEPTTIRGQFFSNQRRTLDGIPGRIELSEGGAWITTLPGQPLEPPRPR